MTEVVWLSLPIFGIVALGWAATRLRLTSPGALDALGAFAFRFALPALVFRLIAGQPLAAAGLAPPVPLDSFLGLLGGAAAPTALFAMGGALALQRIDRATALSAAAITAAKNSPKVGPETGSGPVLSIENRP
jgi:predicted permease